MATTYRTISNFSVSGATDIAAESHTYNGTTANSADIVNQTQDIGTSSEAISMGEIGAGDAEIIEIVNIDTTNFVSVSFENPAVAGTKAIKIKAGQSALLPNPSGTLYAIADTATVKILIKAVEVESP